ncbi:MAG: hypothetical protein LQ340_002602 [Diploschistes diacapsis]|nr:MAG: hypothetical protein LQ340_002602 [Diploschistes diacapsis]
MSNTSEPITAARFAAALTELPLSSLFAKGSELRNSVAHLELSIGELQNFADAGDKDCSEAIEENVEVVSRMKVRLELLRKEVESRGFNWDEGKAREVNGETAEDGVEVSESLQESDSARSTQESQGWRSQRSAAHAPRNGSQAQPVEGRADGGRYGDAELRRLMEERMQQQEDDDDPNGVHL